MAYSKGIYQLVANVDLLVVKIAPTVSGLEPELNSSTKKSCIVYSCISRLCIRVCIFVYLLKIFIFRVYIVYFANFLIVYSRVFNIL